MPWTRYFALSDEPGAPLPSWRVRVFNFALALLGLSVVFCFSFRALPEPLHWSSIYPYRVVFWKGWLTTIGISMAALVLSLVLGLLSALARRSRFLPLRYLATIYVEVVRGTPLLVQILILFYVVANAFGVDNRSLAGIFILAFFNGAYISEIIRAGIESVGKSQLESARAIGLTGAQTYRYIIFPQAVRQTLPPLAGQLVSLVKDSSLLSIISIKEFTWNARSVSALTYGTLESYLPLAAGYLILTLPISLWTRHLEKRHSFDT
jgi:polar amino acid transport system permease protein